MRIDKFLKVSRVLKRRTVACDACADGKVCINGKPVKPSHAVNVGDVVTIAFANGELKFVIKAINEHINAKEAGTLYEIVQ